MREGTSPWEYGRRRTVRFLSEDCMHVRRHEWEPLPSPSAEEIDFLVLAAERWSEDVAVRRKALETLRDLRAELTREDER